MSELETGALGRGRVESRELEQEMRTSFLDYAMSVIVSRALPDVRDGLKPVHRILRTIIAPQRYQSFHGHCVHSLQADHHNQCEEVRAGYHS